MLRRVAHSAAEEFSLDARAILRYILHTFHRGNPKEVEMTGLSGEHALRRAAAHGLFVIEGGRSERVTTGEAAFVSDKLSWRYPSLAVFLSGLIEGVYAPDRHRIFAHAYLIHLMDVIEHWMLEGKHEDPEARTLEMLRDMAWARSRRRRRFVVDGYLCQYDLLGAFNADYHLVRAALERGGIISGDSIEYRTARHIFVLVWLSTRATHWQTVHGGETFKREAW